MSNMSALLYSVMVSELPWPVPYLFVSQSSTILIICKTDSMNPFWSINLANDSLRMTSLQFSSRGEQLNEHGLYELETPGMPTVLTLLINDTARNNQTVIDCSGDRTSFETTLFVLGMSHTLVSLLQVLIAALIVVIRANSIHLGSFRNRCSVY